MKTNPDELAQLLVFRRWGRAQAEILSGNVETGLALWAAYLLCARCMVLHSNKASGR